ncbi:MAG: hypothetical protein LBS49_05240 [Candidatus Accumulibacter sp.]|jgi:hypothetical protein|nr:hypothetical protein [Accumulibacter sp.]
MKRNAAIDATLPLPGVKRPVGRPRKADALTNAERQRRFRQRKAAAVKTWADEVALADVEARLIQRGYDLDQLERDNPHNAWMQEPEISVTANGNSKGNEKGACCPPKPCPHCGQAAYRWVIDSKTNPHVFCDACGHTWSVCLERRLTDPLISVTRNEK